MFNRSDDDRPSRGRSPMPAVVAVMLLAPLVAWSTVTTDVPPAPASAPVPTAALARPAGEFQIRCWQHGRLLFEQNHVTLHNASEYGLRLSGKDRNGRPVYVAETQNATCLVRTDAGRPDAPLNGLR